MIKYTISIIIFDCKFYDNKGGSLRNTEEQQQDLLLTLFYYLSAGALKTIILWR